MPRHSLSVVLPAYNEGYNLAPTVANALEVLEPLGIEFEIIIVDDGSSDETPQICASLTKRYSNVRMLHLSPNGGYGAALRVGFRAARNELVFFTDADGQFRFDQVPEFLAQIDAVEMVLGYRESRQDRWHRKLTSRFGNWLARTLLGVRVRDINCAYKFFWRQLLQTLPLASDGAMINTELLALAARAGWRFRELPVRHYPRRFGVPTGGNAGVILRTLREYFTVKKRLRNIPAGVLSSSADLASDHGKNP